MRLNRTRRALHPSHRDATRPPRRPGRRPIRTSYAPEASRARDCPRSVPPPDAAPVRRPRRRRSLTLLGGVFIATALLLGGSAARAETVQYVALAQTVDQVLSNIRNWIMGILAGVALVFFTLGGLRYLMANGDPGDVEKAKGAFKAAGIGFGLAALAPLVVEILKTIVGGV